MRGLQKESISYADGNIPKIDKSFDGVKTLTHLDQLAQTDINNIVADYAMNGRVTVGSSKTPEFGDFSEVKTFDQALTFIRDAEMAFMDLPSEERKQYDNDPQKWVNHHLQEAEEAQKASEAKAEAEATAQEEATALKNAQTLLDSQKS